MAGLRQLISADESMFRAGIFSIISGGHKAGNSQKSTRFLGKERSMDEREHENIMIKAVQQREDYSKFSTGGDMRFVSHPERTCCGVPTIWVDFRKKALLTETSFNL